MRILNILIIACSAVATAWSATAVASVSASVTDDSGNPVAGAFVEAHLIRDLTLDQFGHITSESAAFSATATTDTDGLVSLGGLPAGGYFLCAYPTVAGYLSNCEWNTTAQRTDISAGEQLTGITLILRKGTIIQIVANDPLALVRAPTGLVAIPSGHYFFPSVRDPNGYFSVAKLVTQSNVQHVYSVTVPNTTTVELFFDSDVSIANSAGQSLPTSVPSDITVTGGSGSVTITITLSN